MTLGGLALAVGILVDDATVEIENIHRNLGLGKPLVQAILDGAQQIAVPTFVSTLSHLHRVRPGRLPRPAPRSTSSRRWPWPSSSPCWRRTCSRARSCRRMVRLPAGRRGRTATADGGRRARPLRPDPRRFRAAVRAAARPRTSALAGTRAAAGARACSRSSACSPLSGAGAAALRRARLLPRRWTPASSACTCARRPARASRRPSRYFAEVEAAIRRDHPGGRDSSWCSTTSACPTAASTWRSATASTIGHGRRRDPGRAQARPPADSTPEYDGALRQELPREFPERDLLLPAGRHRQPDPELRPAGPDRHAGRRARPAGQHYAIAQRARRAGSRAIPGAVDVHLHQVVNAPELHVDVDRTRAAELGLTQRDVANSVLVSLSSSSGRWRRTTGSIRATASPIWSPCRRRSTGSTRSTRSIEHRRSTAATPGAAAAQQPRRRSSAGQRPAVVNHYERAAGLRRLRQRAGHATSAASPPRSSGSLAEFRPKLPPGNTITVRGQVESMDSAVRPAGPRADLRRRCSSTC